MTPHHGLNFSALRWATLLSCTLLSGCGSNSSSSNSSGAAPRYTLSGQVLTQRSAGERLSAQSLSRWQAPHVSGEVLILGQTLTAQSLSERHITVQSVPNTSLLLAQTPQGQSDQAFAQQLEASGLKVQPNYLYQPLTLPNDPGYPGNAGVTVNGTRQYQTYLTRIRAARAWDALKAQNKTLRGALTAVLDTGVTYTHPDLQGRLLDGADCSGAASSAGCVTGAQPAQESSSEGHGTAVTGLLGASGNNGLGLTGLTWSGKTVLPVRVFQRDGASTAALAAGLAYASSQGAKVINMSLGLIGELDNNDSGDQALAQAISAAASADILLVAAAGNTPDDGLYYPASDPNVLAVGAVGNGDDLACYSARPKAGQKALDILAPGGNAGAGSSNCFQHSQDDLLTLSPSGYGLQAGTSEAAPLVSGTASLMRSARPDLSAAQIKRLLISSARTVTAGKLLDSAAAVEAALAAPKNDGSAPTDSLKTYTLTVTAKGAGVSRSYSKVTRAAALPSNLPYELSDLPAGDYALSATLSAEGLSLSGQQQVNINRNMIQNISVR